MKYDIRMSKQREKVLEKKRIAMEKTREKTRKKRGGCDTSTIHPWILDVFNEEPRPKMDYDTETVSIASVSMKV